MVSLTDWCKVDFKQQQQNLIIKKRTEQIPTNTQNFLMYIQNHNEAHCVQNTKTVIKVKKTLMEYFFRCFEEFKKDLLVFEQSSEKKS